MSFESGASSQRRHSEAVLSDLRDQWWSYDYLELIAERLGLAQYQRILDLGCGHGHWGLLLLPLFADDATLVGIDQEPDWIAEAGQRSAALGLADRCTFQEGDAAALPFADQSFDLVTCQTLLMHLAKPEQAITEMLRVLRPGGRLLLAEPSNLANQFSTDTVNRQLSPEEIAELANLFVSTSRGRAALGRGDDSIADVLPEMLRAQGLAEIRVFQNERPSLVAPPYAPKVMAQLQEDKKHAERRFWLWDRDDAKGLYAAGGGAEERFERGYEVFLKRSTIFEAQVEASTYSRTGGGHHYLITGAKL